MTPVFRRALLAAAVAALALGVRPASAQLDVSRPEEEASFEIWNGSARLGTEKFRIYTSHDTLVTASTVRLDGLSETSKLPFEKRTTFLQRTYDSYPLLFQAIESKRDTSQNLALNCVFRDTVAVVYKESNQRGIGESVALPPGRLYIIEPGIYLQMQLLLADFVKGTQDERKQPVLIPSLTTVVDLYLKKGPMESVVVRGKRFTGRRVDITDKLTSFVAWLSEDGRMWKLEAPGQGLRVERGPDLAKAGAPATTTKSTAKKTGAKPAAPRPKTTP